MFAQETLSSYDRHNFNAFSAARNIAAVAKPAEDTKNIVML